MMLKRTLICISAVSILIALTGAGNPSAIDEINQLWADQNPRDAFNRILLAQESGENLDTKYLIELTGVRTLEKIIDGGSDEKANFVNSEHLVLSAPDMSMRIWDIESGNVFQISREVKLVRDKSGVVLNDGKFIYFLRMQDDKQVLYEYRLRNHGSKSLGYFNREEVTVKFSQDDFMMQFVDCDGYPVYTVNLDQREKIDGTWISARDSAGGAKVNLDRSDDLLKIEYNDEVSKMNFDGPEFTLSQDGPNLFFSPSHSNAVIIETDWYPGLYILFDLQKDKAMKLFLPDCMNPSEHEWYFDSGILYIWKSGCDGSGLYKVDFDEKITNSALADLIKEYNLAHGDTGEFHRV